MVKKAELVFIPAPGVGHLVSIIEFAKRLLLWERDNTAGNNHTFTITVLVIQKTSATASDNDAQIKSFAAATADARIRFIGLPRMDPPPLDPFKSPEKFITEYVNSHKGCIKEAIIEHVLNNDVKLAGLVLDFFCTAISDVANELGVPSYVFFTSGAAFLGVVPHLPTRDGKEFEESETESVDIFTYANPVPYRVLPSVCFNKHGGFSAFENIGRRFKEMKGIIVNSFEELESHAVENLMKCDGIPPVYTVGPIIDLHGEIQLQPGGSGTQRADIIRWLDDQPASSVVFLCFGSMGSFGEEQIKEVACGLEKVGVRFLWSLRKPPPKDKHETPDEYTCVEEILPRGFQDRTKGRGMICGWAPQKAVLAHSSIGGFVSHCGWNSILESVWFGVPIVTWPMYAEQQINAFLMVRELGLAVEMRLDYRSGTENHVLADELARAVGCVMDGDNEVRKRVKEVSDNARLTLREGGSSFAATRRLIEDLFGNVS